MNEDSCLVLHTTPSMFSLIVRFSTKPDWKTDKQISFIFFWANSLQSKTSQSNLFMKIELCEESWDVIFCPAPCLINSLSSLPLQWKPNLDQSCSDCSCSCFIHSTLQCTAPCRHRSLLATTMPA